MSLEEDREALRKEAERQALAQLEKAKVRKMGRAVLALFPLPQASETAWTDPGSSLGLATSKLMYPSEVPLTFTCKV